MRKHLYLITEHPDEECVGLVSVTDSRKQTTARKNEEGYTRNLDTETGETYIVREVGLGYYDFEDEDDYVENFMAALETKLEEIDDKHLEKAGVDREKVAA